MGQNLTNGFLYGFSYPLSRVAKLIDDFDKNDTEWSIISWLDKKEAYLECLVMKDRVILGYWPDMITINNYGYEGSQQFIEIFNNSDSDKDIRDKIRDLGLKINGLPRLYITSSFGE